MYAKINNGAVETYPYSISDLKNDNPNTSFPNVISNELLAEFGVVTVVVTGRPSVDYTKTVSEALPTFTDNQWTQTWIVTDASAEEIAERTDDQAASVRNDRNQRLSACDWTQLPDAPVDQAAWATYRQALRDVTAQVGFPWTIVWPEQP
jgi:hypothetical protein